MLTRVFITTSLLTLNVYLVYSDSTVETFDHETINHRTIDHDKIDLEPMTQETFKNGTIDHVSSVTLPPTKYSFELDQKVTKLMDIFTSVSLRNDNIFHNITDRRARENSTTLRNRRKSNNNETWDKVDNDADINSTAARVIQVNDGHVTNSNTTELAGNQNKRPFERFNETTLPAGVKGKDTVGNNNNNNNNISKVEDSSKIVGKDNIGDTSHNKNKMKERLEVVVNGKVGENNNHICKIKDSVEALKKENIGDKNNLSPMKRSLEDLEKENIGNKNNLIKIKRSLKDLEKEIIGEKNNLTKIKRSLEDLVKGSARDSNTNNEISKVEDRLEVEGNKFFRDNENKISNISDSSEVVGKDVRGKNSNNDTSDLKSRLEVVSQDTVGHDNNDESKINDTQEIIGSGTVRDIKNNNVSEKRDNLEIVVNDTFGYIDSNNESFVQSNISQRPEIKQTLNDEEGNMKKFTIQDTFDVLKEYGADDDPNVEVSKLIKHVMKHYLSNCMIIFLYDELFYASVTLRAVITNILEYSPLPVMHGMINTSGLTYHTSNRLLNPPERKCRNFILLTKSLENSAELLGRQRDSRIVFVAYMSSYQIKNFLMDALSHNIVNLLVIADPNLQFDEFVQKSKFYSIDMYTHRLYTDSLGTTVPWMLTSWRNGNFTRPWVDLFPDKLNRGFCGHRFIVSVAQQPPYIFRRQKFEHDSSGKMIQTETDQWDGLEMKILKHMAQYLNLTVDLRETSGSTPGDGGYGKVIHDIVHGRATMGLAGIPMTNDRLDNISFSASHSQDCAVFVTQTSLALSKYRAIFGPFKWEVWVCLVLVYLLAIIPLTFSDKLTLRHLWEKPSEIENMFWYMFGTFTNLFTFRDKNSWTASKKASTRAFVGTYWVFSIIITAAYTGSIIAFITLPVFPETIDTLLQLEDEHYRIITLDSGGWQKFNDTEKETTEHAVFEDWELVPKIEDGLRNVTKGHLLWNYAFLGSKATLEHIVKNNFEVDQKKKQKKRKFHISKLCYQPMSLSLAYPKSSLLNSQLDRFIIKAQQSGLMNKWMRDVQWDNWRNEKGGRLQAGSGDLKMAVPEDRMLTLDDTLGMFLLLSFGFMLAFVAFINECLTHHNKAIFCCHHREGLKPPAITLTSAENTPVTSVENLNAVEHEIERSSVKRCTDAEKPSTSTWTEQIHSRSYSMTDLENRAMEDSTTNIGGQIKDDWTKKRFSQ